MLAVVYGRACDADVPFKHYLADVSRTIAILDTETLFDASTAQHDFRPGFQGPLFHFWRLRQQIAFAPDSAQLFVLDWDRGRRRTWSVKTGAWTNNPITNGLDILSLTPSPTGELLAVVRRSGLELWSTASRQQVPKPPVSGWLCTFSPDGRYLALDRVTCVELSPDGDTVAIRCQEGLRLYSLRTGSERVLLPEYFEIHRTANGYGTKSRSGDSTYGVSFSPDGKLLAGWGEYGLKFFDMSNDCELSRTVADRSIRVFVFSPDGKSYATGHSDGKVALWDVATGSEIRFILFRGNGPESWTVVNEE
jgi:WD40 repeat protein